MTRIQWTERTWNPVVGCTNCGEGCRNCYAVPMARRIAATGNKDYAGLVRDDDWTGRVRCLDHRLDEPLRRKKPTMYFVCSMGDLFHDSVSVGFLDSVFGAMECSPQHTFQVLTKRIARAHEYITWRCGRKDLPNVWLGVSVCTQADAEEKIPELLATPAAVQFVSCEPLLESVSLLDYANKLDWIIVGCETGSRRRRCDLSWVWNIVGLAEHVKVPVFVKQLDVGGKVLKAPKNPDDPWPAAWPEWAKRRELPR